MSRVAQQALLANASAPAAISFIGVTAIPEVDSGPVTALNVPIGAAAADRIVFIMVHWYSATAPSLTSATIGGVAATIHLNTRGPGKSGANTVGVAIISAAVPTGTTTTVTMSFSSAVIPYLGTYRVTGLQSLVAKDTVVATPSSTNPYSGVIDVTNQGIMLFGSTVYSAATGYNTTGGVDNYKNSISNNQFILGASLAVTADQLNRTVSISRTGGTGSTFGGAIIAASFR